ncbi:hypothetical protein B0T18DRAFT_390004 [Schizothecium vesticola]|uniref:NACHT domain-containing protein n=1 Tax=Schizothecium vesticola TaxID=314040 RepID=A0AA40K9B5_9PEZI|nr:hypothetical protein B0T18DRAFT_390004 [Schizothecium vesticola]
MEEALRFSTSCDWILAVENGKPGSGKSVLAGHIIGSLQGMVHPNSSVLISHFCTYSYASSTRYEMILRSMLLQIIQANDDLIAYVHRLKETELAMRTLSPKALEQLILTVASAVSQTPGETKYVHVIIDGLDECEEENGQSRLITLLRQLITASTSTSSAIFKALLLSRDSSFLRKRLRKTTTAISLTEEKHHLDKAIQSYAYAKLGMLRSRLMGMGIGDADIRNIATTISQKAEANSKKGMFILARLVLEYISKNMFYNKDEIVHTAENLPRELGEFFDLRSTERMKSIFGWIAYAKRPLRTFEFQSALVFGAGNLEVAEVAPSYLFNMCAPLVEERRDSTYSFIHVSVKEYLQGEDGERMISEAVGNQEHAVASITCLLSGLTVFAPAFSDSQQSVRVIKGLHAFQWPRGDVREVSIVDNQLECLREFEGMYKCAKAILQSRSAKSIAGILQNGGILEGHYTASDGLRTLLSSYQTKVECLLPLRTFPGVSMEDFERFKRSHRTSAFTCRLSGCARSTIGFNSLQLRAEHEQSHVRRLYCEYPGCQYPSFSSAQTLRSHVAKWHDEANRTKQGGSIRRQATSQPKVPYSHRYLGIHCKVEDALDYDDRIFPRASTRLGPRHQAVVLPWPGRPVEYMKPLEIKKSGRKDGKLSKDIQAALEAERQKRETRPKWVQDEPSGWVQRGGEDTISLLYKPHEDYGVRISSEAIDGYIEMAKTMATSLGLPPRSTNLQDVARDYLFHNQFDPRKALKELEKLPKSEFKEPELTPAEQKKFEEAVAKFGSDLHSVKKHVKTLPASTITRYYYTWKKSERGKQVWGSYPGRLGKKDAKKAEAVAKQVADDRNSRSFQITRKLWDPLRM